MNDVLKILLVLLLVFANGFFVAAEFALVKARLSRLEVLAKDGGRLARLSVNVLRNLNAYLSACQLGITLASLALGWLGEPLVASVLQPVFQLMEVSEPQAHGISIFLGFILITALHIILGEQVPKILAIQKAEPTVHVIAAPLMLFYGAFRPFIWVLNETSNWILRMIGIGAGDDHDSALSEEELRMLLAESTEHGELTERELSLIENVMDLQRNVARRVMVPRNQVVFLNSNDKVTDSIHTAAASGHTRLPLCDGDMDHVVGYVHVKDIFRHLTGQGAISVLQEIAHDVVFVQETMRLGTLLRRFQGSKGHMAIVVDEYGGVAGMVTLENVLEELVGPIQDEFDSEPELVRPMDTSASKFEVDGMCPLDELVELTGVKLPESDADSTGGLVMEQLGRIPEAGDTFDLDAFRFTVIEADAKRVIRLTVERIQDG